MLMSMQNLFSLTISTAQKLLLEKIVELHLINRGKQKVLAAYQS